MQLKVNIHFLKEFHLYMYWVDRSGPGEQITITSLSSRRRTATNTFGKKLKPDYPISW